MSVLEGRIFHADKIIASTAALAIPHFQRYYR